MYWRGLCLELDALASKPIRIERAIKPDYVREEAFASLDRYKSEQALFEPAPLKEVEAALETANFELQTPFGILDKRSIYQERIKPSETLSYSIEKGLSDVEERLSRRWNKDYIRAILTRDVAKLYLAAKHRDYPSGIITSKLPGQMELTHFVEGLTSKSIMEAKYLELGVVDYLADVVLREQQASLYELRRGKGFNQGVEDKLKNIERNVHFTLLNLEQQGSIEEVVPAVVNLKVPTMAQAAEFRESLSYGFLSFMAPFLDVYLIPMALFVFDDLASKITMGLVMPSIISGLYLREAYKNRKQLKRKIHLE